MTSAQLTTIAVGTGGFLVFLTFRRWLWMVALPPAVAGLLWYFLDKVFVTSH
ncbi:MAG TPA: hypothetical protein VLX85_04745 [Stellaceae bacterium]|nr:hypothetical protein [Stellaceae bacterium]